MDSILPGVVFLLIFAGIALAGRSRSQGPTREEELLERMTPATVEDKPADLSIVRESRAAHSQFLEKLYQSHPARRLEETILRAGLYLSVSEVLLMMALLFLCGEAVGYLLFESGLFCFAMGAGLAIAPLAYLRFRTQQRLKQFGQQLPFALDLMKSSLEAGHSLVRGLQVVVQEFTEPLGGEFRIALEQSRIGVPLPRALEVMLKRVPDQDLSLLVIAVKVQTQAGSSLAGIIGRLAEIVRTRQRLRLQIRALTAQSRFSGMLVGLLPVAVLLIFHVIQPAYVDLLFHDPTGHKILKTAIGLDLAALLLIRKMLRLDY